jgi:hypothetical protein
MRTKEYAAYSGNARGLEEMFATGVKGANQICPEANNAYKIANNPAKTDASAANELFQPVRSEIPRKMDE